DALPDGGEDQVDGEDGGGVLAVEDRVHLDHVEADHPPGLREQLHHQVAFADGEPAGDRGADAGGERGVHHVEVEARVDAFRAVARDLDRPLHDAPDSVTVDNGRRVDGDARLAKQLAFAGVQVA